MIVWIESPKVHTRNTSKRGTARTPLSEDEKKALVELGKKD